MTRSYIVAAVLLSLCGASVYAADWPTGLPDCSTVPLNDFTKITGACFKQGPAELEGRATFDYFFPVLDVDKGTVELQRADKPEALTAGLQAFETAKKARQAKLAPPAVTTDDCSKVYAKGFTEYKACTEKGVWQGVKYDEHGNVVYVPAKNKEEAEALVKALYVEAQKKSAKLFENPQACPEKQINLDQVKACLRKGDNKLMVPELQDDGSVKYVEAANPNDQWRRGSDFIADRKAFMDRKLAGSKFAKLKIDCPKLDGELSSACKVQVAQIQQLCAGLEASNTLAGDQQSQCAALKKITVPALPPVLSAPLKAAQSKLDRFREIQRLKFPIKIEANGKITDPNTQSLLRIFQEKYNLRNPGAKLDVNGQLDDKTLAALEKYNPAAGAPDPRKYDPNGLHVARPGAGARYQVRNEWRCSWFFIFPYNCRQVPVRYAVNPADYQQTQGFPDWQRRFWDRQTGSGY